MVNDNSDTDIKDENDEDAITPFGGWASAPPEKGDTAQGGDESASAAAKQPKKEAATIPSFSATFGKTGNEHVDLPPVDEILEDEKASTAQYDVTLERTSDLYSSPAEFAERAEQQDDTLSSDTQSNTPEGHPDALTFGTPEDTSEPQEPTTSQPVSNNDDPFAWSPEEAPQNDAPREPRRSFGEDATWMATGSDFDYEAEKAKQQKLANPQDYKEEEEEEIIPTVNPYTFGKEDEWQAPPMTIEEEAAAEAEAAEAEAAEQAAAAQTPEEPSQQNEPAPPSPFDFTAYDDPTETTQETPELPVEPQVNTHNDLSQDLTDPMVPAENLSQPDIIPEAASLPPEENLTEPPQNAPMQESNTVEVEMEPDATIAPVAAEDNYTEEPTAAGKPEETITEDSTFPPLQAEANTQQPITTFQADTPPAPQDDAQKEQEAAPYDKTSPEAEEPHVAESPFAFAAETPEESFTDTAAGNNTNGLPEDQHPAFDVQETPPPAKQPEVSPFDGTSNEAFPQQETSQPLDEPKNSANGTQSQYSTPPSSPEQFIRQGDEGGPQAVMTHPTDYGTEPQASGPPAEMPPPHAPTNPSEEAPQSSTSEQQTYDEPFQPAAIDPFVVPETQATEESPEHELGNASASPFTLAEPSADYASPPTEDSVEEHSIFNQAPETASSETEFPAAAQDIAQEQSAPESNIFDEALPDAEEPEQSDNIFGATPPSEQEAPEENILTPEQPDTFAEPEQPQDFALTPQQEEAAAAFEQPPETPHAQEDHSPMAMPVGEVGAVGNTNNQRHYEPSDIQHILQEHANWLASGGKDGRRANFRNANLQGFDLSSAQLAEASFRGANLVGANLSGSDLRGADLSEAVLESANLGNANLATAILARADLRTTDLTGADLQSADLSSALMLGANLSGLNLSAAILQETNLQSANLSQAILQQANLRGANLTGANLSAANLASANCRDVRFEHAVLDNAVLQGANMKNASMQGTSLIGVDIAAAEETSAEHRQESLHAEQSQIQQEWERVKAHEAQVNAKQAQIQQREMTMQTDRANVERARREIRTQYEGMTTLIDMTHRVMSRHRLHDKLFKYFGITWFIFTILAFVSILLFVKALEISDLDWLSLSVVLGGCTLIMGLFIATTIRSIKLSNNLKRLLDVYEQQMPKQDNSGQ